MKLFKVLGVSLLLLILLAWLGSKVVEYFVSEVKPDLRDSRRTQIVKKEYPPHEPGAFLVEVAGVPFLIPHAYFRTPNPVPEGKHSELSLQASLPEVGADGWVADKELGWGRWMSVRILPPELYTEKSPEKLFAEQIVYNRLKARRTKKERVPEILQGDFLSIVKHLSGHDLEISDISSLVGTLREKEHYAIARKDRVLGYASCDAFQPKRSPSCSWHWQEPNERLAIIVTFSRKFDPKTFEIVERVRARISKWNANAIKLLGNGQSFLELR